MIQTVVAAAVLYIATAVDLLVILLIFFARAKTRKEYRDIYVGQYLGSIILDKDGTAKDVKAKNLKGVAKKLAKIGIKGNLAG
ncbi:cadmium resistance transporter, partial [Staphylococcus aureus]|uniref:cadmium resistance transporter n=1 Tax=Staphylococcus aureus TaxID=1280 RepID=UPI002A5A0958